MYFFSAFSPPRGAPFHQSEKQAVFCKKQACGRKHDLKTKTEVPAVVFACLAIHR
jgi:hypothetical protein